MRSAFPYGTLSERVAARSAGAHQEPALARKAHLEGLRPSASVPPHLEYKISIALILRGTTMYRALGAAALLSIAIAAPVQDAAAQDPVGGAILGGVTGGVIGGALGGGRGAAVGAVVGGA